MAQRALESISLALLLFLSIGCTADYKNERAKFPLPPDPPQPPLGARARGESQVYTVFVPQNMVLPAQPNSTKVVGVIPNSGKANDTTPVGEPVRKIAINDTDAILADLFKAEHPGRLQVYFFYSPLCPFSNRVLPNVTILEQEFQNSTEWHDVNVLEPEGFAFFEKTAKEKGLSKGDMVVPLMFAGKYRLVGFQAISELLPMILANSTAS